ncbi:hypothetical protein EV2_039466 [Malus domestica]
MSIRSTQPSDCSHLPCRNHWQQITASNESTIKSLSHGYKFVGAITLSKQHPEHPSFNNNGNNRDQFVAGGKSKKTNHTVLKSDDIYLKLLVKLYCFLVWKTGSKEIAKARIEKPIGECLTFDQLALRARLGQNMVLLRGPKNSREVVKHFSPAPGVPHNHTKPYVRSKGWKFEKARGKRNNKELGLKMLFLESIFALEFKPTPNSGEERRRPKIQTLYRTAAQNLYHHRLQTEQLFSRHTEDSSGGGMMG